MDINFITDVSAISWITPKIKTNIYIKFLIKVLL